MSLINFHNDDNNSKYVMISDRFVLGQGLINTRDRHIIGDTHNKYIMITDKGDTITFKEKYIVEWTIAFRGEEDDLFSDYLTFSGLGNMDGKYIRFNQKCHYDFETLTRYDTNETFRIIKIRVANKYPDKSDFFFNCFSNCNDFCDHIDTVEKNIKNKITKKKEMKLSYLNPKKYNFDEFIKLNYDEFKKGISIGNIYYLITDSDSNIVIQIKVKKLTSTDVFECSLVGHDAIIIKILIYQNDKIDKEYALFDMLAEIDIIESNDIDVNDVLDGYHYVNAMIPFIKN